MKLCACVSLMRLQRPASLSLSASSNEIFADGITAVFVRQKYDIVLLNRIQRSALPMGGEATVLPCALKHGLTEEDIRCAWRNASAVRVRNFDIPCIFAAAGPDTRGRLIELLLAEREDGSFVAYHAMKLTPKMARELGLG